MAAVEGNGVMKRAVVRRDRGMASVLAVIVLMTGLGLMAGPAHATLCLDGQLSPSSGRGTCSHHGGIDYGPLRLLAQITARATVAWGAGAAVGPVHERT
jgi:hypothetical protein